MPIHQRKSRSQAASPAVAASWQRILEAIPAGAYTCDEAGLITYFNPLVESVWGRAPKLRDSADRYCGSFKLYLSDGKPIRHDECWMALALREGREFRGEELLIERPDGNRIFGLAHIYPLRNAQARIIGAVNLVIDVTEQKKLAADHRKFRSIVTKYHDATLAMIEVAGAALAGMTWTKSTFS